MTVILSFTQSSSEFMLSRRLSCDLVWFVAMRSSLNHRHQCSLYSCQLTFIWFNFSWMLSGRSMLNWKTATVLLEMRLNKHSLTTKRKLISSYYNYMINFRVCALRYLTYMWWVSDVDVRSLYQIMFHLWVRHSRQYSSMHTFIIKLLWREQVRYDRTDQLK